MIVDSGSRAEVMWKFYRSICILSISPPIGIYSSFDFRKFVRKTCPLEWLK
jgi:hypothetical protein